MRMGKYVERQPLREKADADVEKIFSKRPVAKKYQGV